MWLSIRPITPPPPLQTRPGQAVEERSQPSASPQSLMGDPDRERSVGYDPASCFLLACYGRNLALDSLDNKEKDTNVTSRISSVMRMKSEIFKQ